MKQIERLKLKYSTLEETTQAEYESAKQTMAPREFPRNYYVSGKRYLKRVYPDLEEMKILMLDKINGATGVIMGIVIVSITLAAISLIASLAVVL